MSSPRTRLPGRRSGLGLMVLAAGATGTHAQIVLSPAPSEPTPPLLATPMVACFAPGTSPDYIRRVTALVDARNRAFVGADYYTFGRWSGAAGTPRALTWSFVPDG